MEKLGCVIGIVIFIGVTMIVMLTDAGTMHHTVSFSNTGLTVNVQKDMAVNSSNSNVTFNTEVPKISSKDVKTEQVNIDLELKELDNSNVSYNSSNANLNHYSGIKSSDIKNLKKGLSASQSSLTHSPSRFNDNNLANKNVPFRNPDRYAVKNIDWSIWKSNFINRIMDDSVTIPELANYPRGTMYYYSFTVDSTGRVYNVKVKSLTISSSDREKIANLIRSYSYKEITRFPANSNRSTANVSSITVFSDETEYSSPSDIHDLEQIRVRL